MRAMLVTDMSHLLFKEHAYSFDFVGLMDKTNRVCKKMSLCGIERVKRLTVRTHQATFCLRIRIAKHFSITKDFKKEQ